MDTLPIIIGLGIGAFLLTNKSEPKSSVKKNILNLEAEIVKTDCLSTQFKNKKGECKYFWIEGETDELVAKELDNQKKSFGNKSWDFFCTDSMVDEEFVSNKNYTDIVKNTILKLWNPTITANSLPPTNKSPEYIKEIWKKVTNIYYLKICGIDLTKN